MRNLKPGIVFVASVLMAALAFDALAQTEARYAWTQFGMKRYIDKFDRQRQKR